MTSTEKTERPKKDDLETKHLHLSGVYQGLTALDLMNNVDTLNKEEVV
ncbi:667_t:CDS:2, partial [Gigaspora margarita]